MCGSFVHLIDFGLYFIGDRRGAVTSYISVQLVVIKVWFGERQVCGVSCIGRSFAVDKNPFAGCVVQNEQGTCHPIPFDAELSTVLRNHVGIFKQMVRKVLPLLVVQPFGCNNADRLYVDLIFFPFESCL